MELGIKGRVAMVAAGTKGIGLAIAKGLLAEGCQVSVCARNAPESPLPSGIAFQRVDVGNVDDISQWFQTVDRTLGQVSILVTNTGGPPVGLWEDMTDDQWQEGVDSTLLNVVRMVREAAPRMRESSWGRIVHLTSYVAKEPGRLLPISSTLRAGLMALTRLQSVDLAPFGVTVNGVLPGHTLTDRQIHLATVRAEREGTTVEQALHDQALNVPLGRLARAEEIADAAVFLASERASYVTGVNLLVDGGIVKGTA